MLLEILLHHKVGGSNLFLLHVKGITYIFLVNSCYSQNLQKGNKTQLHMPVCAQSSILYFKMKCNSSAISQSLQAKAELPLEGKLNFLPWEFLLLKKLEIEKIKTTKNTTFKTDIIKLVLVFSFSNFFTNKNSQVRKLRAVQLQQFSFKGHPTGSY